MITVQAVTKRYGPYTAVDDVTFAAEPGRVTGFLGPNGAGKSTTLRVIVGLTPPLTGIAHVLGRRFVDLPNPGLEVGVLLDASAHHAGRTGREVLTLAQRTMGCHPGRVAQMLDLVSLTDEEADRGSATTPGSHRRCRDEGRAALRGRRPRPYPMVLPLLAATVTVLRSEVK